MSILEKLRERKPLIELLERKPLMRVLERKPLAAMEKPLLSQESSPSWTSQVVVKPQMPVVKVPLVNLAPPPPPRILRQGPRVSVE